MGLTRSLADLSSIVTTNLSNGFVGIGSTIPNQKLDVVGVTTIGSASNISFTTGPSDIGSAATVENIDGTFSLNMTGNVTASSFVGIASELSGVGIKAYAKVVDEKGYSDHGGTFSNNAWRIRDLNTVITDCDMFGNTSGAIGVTVDSNKFTLPAGTYVIEYNAASFRVNRNSTRLYNVTDSEVVGGATTIVANAHGYSYHNWYAMGRCYGFSPKITLTGSTEFRVEHQCTYSTSSYGFGYELSSSTFGNTYYTLVHIYKI
tara:strand:- start:1521 stop:2303 length:783 start_codon:yes stop_codon:yes gene_type:complete